jgi:hypothetical protein
MARSMMAHANLSISFWGDALLTANYILNHVSSKSISFTPYELWNNKKPNLGYFIHGGMQLIFTIILMNMRNLVLKERSVSL